jgi:hypothetical protein
MWTEGELTRCADEKPSHLRPAEGLHTGRVNPVEIREGSLTPISMPLEGCPGGQPSPSEMHPLMERGKGSCPKAEKGLGVNAKPRSHAGGIEPMLGAEVCHWEARSLPLPLIFPSSVKWPRMQRSALAERAGERVSLGTAFLRFRAAAHPQGRQRQLHTICTQPSQCRAVRQARPLALARKRGPSRPHGSFG